MAKEWGHESFRVNENTSILCHGEDTRYGFRHLAVVFKDGRAGTKAKVCYYNRTWESFRYESVLHQVCDKAGELTEEEKAIVRGWTYHNHG